MSIGKAEARPVKLGPRLGTRWLILEGVAVGDRVVVEGTVKARPGTPRNPTDVTEAELAQAAADAVPGASPAKR